MISAQRSSSMAASSSSSSSQEEFKAQNMSPLSTAAAAAVGKNKKIAESSSSSATTPTVISSSTKKRRLVVPTRRTTASTQQRSIVAALTWKSLALFVVSALLAVQICIFPFTAHHAIEVLGANARLLSAVEYGPGGSTTTASSSSAARRQQGKKKRRGMTERTADGSFNGGPIYYRTSKLRDMETKVHCIGETYTKEAWKFRSCRFEQRFCYNASANEFVIFDSPEERNKASLYSQREFLHVADSIYRLNDTNAMSIGGLNLKWGMEGTERLKWFPQIVSWDEQNADEGIAYYELPESTVLLPYHSLNGANPGHLVWDDWLALYNLLRIFFIEPDEHFLLPLRYVLRDGERGLWASCDLRAEKLDMCRHMINKFWPLMVGHDSPYNFSSTSDSTFVETTHPIGSSSLICAKTGLAGLGPLTDHGLFKAHGWEQSDYRTMHNVGRGPLLYEFRNFMIRNLNIPPVRPLQKPFRVVFSQKSSDIPMRSIAFDKQIAFVKERIPEAQVEAYILKDLSVYEQMDLASQTSVFVSLCGGGAVTGMFLPKGASVVVYYAENGGTRNGKRDFQPALLDWDVLNSMSHLRVHWVPRNTRDTELDLQILVMMIRNELKLIEHNLFS